MPRDFRERWTKGSKPGAWNHDSGFIAFIAGNADGILMAVDGKDTDLLMDQAKIMAEEQDWKGSDLEIDLGRDQLEHFQRMFKLSYPAYKAMGQPFSNAFDERYPEDALQE